MSLAPPALYALAATVILIRVLSPAALHLGLSDVPGGRKRHRRPVPLVGGVAVVAGWAIGVLALPIGLGEFRTLWAGALILLITGLLDDLHELPTRARFAAQIGAIALVAAWGGPVLRDFGMLLGDFTAALGWFSIPVTIFCAVGVINAINMTDGIDGLAATAILVALAGIGILAAAADRDSVLAMVVVLGAAVGGFAVLNIRWRAGHPAPVFFGDAGSMTLGFVLAWMLIGYSQGESRVFAPVTALWLLAGPLMDTVFVMIHRRRAGGSPFAAGRDHLHHLFLHAGFSVTATWACLGAFSLACAGLGVVSELIGMSEHIRFYVFLASCAAYYFVLDRAWRTRRWLGRPVTAA